MTACLCRMGQAAPRGFLYTPRGVFVLEHRKMKSHVTNARYPQTLHSSAKQNNSTLATHNLKHLLIQRNLSRTSKVECQIWNEVQQPKLLFAKWVIGMNDEHRHPHSDD